ncbi:MAG: hypothetical protein EA401_12070 [Planctomycetota bacterium]|nr:MAG: hypothetical protein EA401_12070 [Planctomycetota bacterium]
MDDDTLWGWRISFEDTHQGASHGRLFDPQGKMVGRGSASACRQLRLEHLRRSSDWAAPSRMLIPTLGGRQWWTDTYLHCGWRIQQHYRTSRYRLLDPYGLRRAQGTFTRCRLAAEYFRVQRNIQWDQDSLVLIVHGLLRSGSSCAGLLRHLRQQGHQAYTWEYASAKTPLDNAAESLRHTLNHLHDIHRVHLITHSLGSLVVRSALAQHSHPKVRSLVSIFPPSQGSQLAERMHGWKPYQWLTGPVGQEIRPQQISQLPPPNIPTMVIAGSKGWGVGRLLGVAQPSDGTVSVAETRLPDCEHHTVPRGHSFGMNHPTVCDLVSDWLQRQSDAGEKHP